MAIGDLAPPEDARVSLLACSSQFGLTFLATHAGQPITQCIGTNMNTACWSAGVCAFETAVLASVDTAPISGSKNTLG